MKYRCTECGAICTHAVWAALELPAAEDKCPGCGKWAEFEAVAPAAARPEFGKKAA